MAGSSTQIIKLDDRAVKAIERLAKAIEHHNTLFIEKERRNRDESPVVVPPEPDPVIVDKIEKELKRESGVDIDRQMLEDAVAEGDDPSILEETPVHVDPHTARMHQGLAGFREVGRDASLGERMGHPGGTYG